MVKLFNVLQQLQQRMFGGSNDVNRMNNTDLDVMDCVFFEQMEAESKELRQLCSELRNYTKVNRELCQDIFGLFFRVHPMLKAVPPRGTEVNRQQEELIVKSKEYQELRGYSVVDEYTSVSATIVFLKALLEQLEQDKDLRDLFQQQDNMDSGEDSKDQEGQGQGQGTGQQQQEQQEETEQQKQEREERQQRRQQQEEQLNKSMAEQKQKMRKLVRGALQQASNEAGETSGIISALGWGDEGSEFNRLPIEDKKYFLEQVRRTKGSMVELIGKMKQITLTARKEKIKSSQMAICGVTVGNNISKVLPSELMLLRHPAYRGYFYKKYADKQLMQYELQVRNNMGKGSIIVLVDDSGSMYNIPREMARGACFGLADIAKTDKRNFAVNIFSERGQEWKRQYPKGQMNIQETIDLIEASFGGGTSYEGPLSWAMDLIEKESGEFKDADIVLITDGYCDIDNSFRKKLIQAKKKNNFSVIAVTLDNAPAHMSDWCDHIYTNFNQDSIIDMMQKF